MRPMFYAAWKFRRCFCRKCWHTSEVSAIVVKAVRQTVVVALCLSAANSGLCASHSLGLISLLLQPSGESCQATVAENPSRKMNTSSLIWLTLVAQTKLSALARWRMQCQNGNEQQKWRAHLLWHGVLLLTAIRAR